MASTFTKINAVNVNPNQNDTQDAYPDASLQLGGANVAAVVPTNGMTVATYGQLFRGMPVALASGTGKIVPPNVASTTAARYFGFLYQDVTGYLVAQGCKIGVVKRGRIRTYAGGTIQIGAPVKIDTTANFSGVLAWVEGTDTVESKIGHAYPITDGSNNSANTPVVTFAQGDQIFVDLI